MHLHAVRFYRDAPTLCAWIARIIARGLTENQPAIVIATSEHLERVRLALSQAFDVAGLEGAGTLVMSDADLLLDTFMVGDMPDLDLFEDQVSPILDEMSGRDRRTVRAYGEMVDILCKRGQTNAALHLEDCWNHLARVHPLELFCAYSVDHHLADADLRAICWRHTHASADWLMQA
jgi:hypothetical protein